MYFFARNCFRSIFYTSIELETKTWTSHIHTNTKAAIQTKLIIISKDIWTVGDNAVCVTLCFYETYTRIQTHHTNDLLTNDNKPTKNAKRSTHRNIWRTNNEWIDEKKRIYFCRMWLNAWNEIGTCERLLVCILLMLSGMCGVVRLRIMIVSENGCAIIRQERRCGGIIWRGWLSSTVRTLLIGTVWMFSMIEQIHVHIRICNVHRKTNKLHTHEQTNTICEY